MGLLFLFVVFVLFCFKVVFDVLIGFLLWENGKLFTF